MHVQNLLCKRAFIYTGTKQTQSYIYRHQTNNTLQHSVIYTHTTIQYNTTLYIQTPNKQYSTTQRYIYRHQTNNTVQHSVILSHTQHRAIHTHTHTTIQYNSALYIHTNITIQCSSSSSNNKKNHNKTALYVQKENDAVQHSVRYTERNKTIQYNQRRIQYRRAGRAPLFEIYLFLFFCGGGL